MTKSSESVPRETKIEEALKIADKEIVKAGVKLAKRILLDMYLPHEPVKVNTGTKTIVEQHHEETTNINKIIGRYRRSGVMPPQMREPTYADVSGVSELLDVKIQMADAIEKYESLYNKLPKSISDKFHDVHEFMEYVENQEQIIAQPVAVPEPEPEPAPEPTPDKIPPAE